MGKRKYECLFCKSRTCNTRIVRFEEPKYDEVACSKHMEYLEKHSDNVLGSGNGIIRTHITSSSRLMRGDKFEECEG